jgi:amino-acid N-acetyltransferase
MALGIRRGELDDLPAIVPLLDSAGLPTADLKSVSVLKIWLCEEQGTVRGVIGLERFGSKALLRSLAVMPEYRKRGLGRDLVGQLEREARAEGIEQLVLLTETAEAFFRHLGYAVTHRSQVSEEVKQSAEFRSLCPASAVCMIKWLQG